MQCIGFFNLIYWRCGCLFTAASARLHITEEVTVRLNYQHIIFAVEAGAVRVHAAQEAIELRIL